MGIDPHQNKGIIDEPEIRANMKRGNRRKRRKEKRTRFHLGLLLTVLMFQDDKFHKFTFPFIAFPLMLN